MKLSNQSRLGVLMPILLIVLIALAILTVVIFQYSVTAPKPPESQPSYSSFDAEKFYNQVQTGMTYDQVVALAKNQPANCELSSAPPPTDYRICTWQYTFTSVTVSFSNQKVTHKSRRSL